MKKITTFIVVLALAILVQVLFHYRGFYSPPPMGKLDFREIGVVKAQSKEFQDEFLVGRGTVLFDFAHENKVGLDDLNVLISRLAARGYSVEYLEDAEDLKEKLKYANSFVVISPGETYSQHERNLVEKFVEKKGKLLLIQDPSRKGVINTLAVEFDLFFDSGYLYNQVENDGNYQYIFLEDFQHDEITDGLDKVSFYVASPITAQGKALAFTSENTYSSIKPKQRFTPIVLTGGNVLAIGDMTFMMEPYNAVYDNNRLVSNIADFLTSGGRVFHVDDYPYYLGGEFFVVYSEGSLLDEGIKLKNFLGKKASLRQSDPEFNDALILGSYDTSGVGKYLKDAGISINNEIIVGGIGALEKEGSFLIALTSEEGRNVLLVLGDDEDGVEEAIDALDELEENLLTNFLVYSSYAPGKEPENVSVSPEAEVEAEEEVPVNETSEEIEEVKVVIGTGEKEVVVYIK